MSQPNLRKTFEELASLWRAHDTVHHMGYFENYDIDPVQAAIKKRLGGVDTLYSENTPFVRMYAAAPCCGLTQAEIRPEVGVLLDLLKVEKARQLLASPDEAIGAGISYRDYYDDKIISGSLNLKPSAVLFLAETANRDLLRQRFPRAKLPDDRIDAALKPWAGQFKLLPENSPLRKMSADVPRTVRIHAIRRELAAA